MSPPPFSVICSVRNHATLIRPCVESVLAQDDPNVDFVVQDAASTDGTLDILREYGDRIRLVSEPDAGAGDGLFRALRRARGEFWGSCLSDERLVPDAVSWARRTFAAHPDLGAIYGYAEGVDREGTPLSRQDAGEFSIEDLLTYRQLPPFPASFFRMASYRQLGLWDYTGGGELDLWCRFAVRFPIRWFPKLVAYYGMDRSAMSNQMTIYAAERDARLETLRRLFHDDPAGQPFQHLEARAYAGYFLRFAGMFVRNGDCDVARESFRQAQSYWPGCAADWLHDGHARLLQIQHRVASSSTSEGSPLTDPPVLLVGLRRSFTVAPGLQALAAHLRAPSGASCAEALRFLPEDAERLRLAWLQYTVDQPFNVWTLALALGIRRVAIFGGEGWGLALHRQLEPAGIACAAVIENNASTRHAAMIPAPYYSLSEFLANGPAVDAVLSSLQGDHDRDVLPALQCEIGTTPVLSWKTLFALLSAPVTDRDVRSVRL